MDLRSGNFLATPLLAQVGRLLHHTRDTRIRLENLFLLNTPLGERPRPKTLGSPLNLALKVVFVTGYLGIHAHKFLISSLEEQIRLEPFIARLHKYLNTIRIYNTRSMSG